MEKVKISTLLLKDTIVLVDGNSNITTISDVLEDLESYKTKKIYTTTEHHASFKAESIIDDAIENEYNNGMYEDWDDSIKADVTKEDIADLQKIFDRILAKNPSSNIAYESDKLIEIDICVKKMFKCNEDGVTEWCIAENKKQAYECFINNWGKETMDEYEEEFHEDNPGSTLDDFIEEFINQVNPEEDFILETEEGKITKKVSEWVNEVEGVPMWFACEDY